MKKIFGLFVLVFSCVLFLVSCDNKQYDIVVTNFVGYDAVRAVTKDSNYSIKMLLKPGTDIHKFDPTPNDKKAILKCKLFVYVGGETDATWVEENILADVKDSNIKIINMFDVLKDNLIEEDDHNHEEEHEDHDHEEEYDEHVWTNPLNFVMIVEAINKVMVQIDENNKDLFNENTNSYVADLKVADLNMQSAIESTNKDKIVVGDRNPFLYFENHYNIEVLGALHGCSSDKNAPTSKIIELKNALEENNLKIIFILELSDGLIANSIKTEVDNDIKNGSYNGPEVSIKTLYSMQIMSDDDFNNGKTYLDYFNHNIEVIKGI